MSTLHARSAMWVWGMACTACYMIAVIVAIDRVLPLGPASLRGLIVPIVVIAILLGAERGNSLRVWWRNQRHLL